MKITIFVLWTNLMTACAFLCAQDTPIVSTQIQKLADQALEASNNNSLVPTMAATSIETFESAMDQLGAVVDAQTLQGLQPLDGKSLMAKVILIAADRHQHPELYTKIANEFFTMPPSPRDMTKESQVLFSPDFSAEFAKEEYRHVWEYYLMSCQRIGSPELSSWRPAEALGKIGNDDSLIALVRAYNHTLSSKLETGANLSELIIQLSAIVDIASPDALRSLFSCFTVSEENEALFLKDVSIGKTVEQVFTQQFTMMSAEQLNKWHTYIRAYPKEGINSGTTKIYRERLKT